MAQKKASLACAECGSRNYSINVSSNSKPTRLEVTNFVNIVKNTPCIRNKIGDTVRQTGSIFKVLKDTTWPDRKQRWHDFISVLEYTAFFTVIIYAFDELLSRAMSALINFF